MASNGTYHLTRTPCPCSHTTCVYTSVLGTVPAHRGQPALLGFHSPSKHTCRGQGLVPTPVLSQRAGREGKPLGSSGH